MSCTTHRSLWLPLDQWTSYTLKSYLQDATLLLQSHATQATIKKTQSCSIKALSTEDFSEVFSSEPIMIVKAKESNSVSQKLIDAVQGSMDATTNLISMESYALECLLMETISS
jgi:hypothetical protein